jgi:tetratricopeptide (TPR) repeat protein
MTKVSLRVYNREIESMIEGGQLDEAVAHCQDILKTFPMHVDTYRLLGKSFLEARRYTDAADIFQRALMAVPDDFVSHVGMSIIRDDEGKLDDAIWHMQRAFEVQPSNTAIQGELRRLYGRRDGVEPPKIRLTRDALANMYSQGELFNQAIAEIRAVLADDANRPDLQVMLARAYYHAGQKVEAAEMSANLLKKYMYCVDALRILVDVLPDAARAENTQIYRQRLHMLDPYTSFVTGSVFATDQVGDGAVSLERLDYRVGVAPTSSQPNWASSLGIKLVNEKHAEPAPYQVNPTASIEPPPVPAPAVNIQPPVPAPDANIQKSPPPVDDKSVPDWMRSAGWKESSGSVPENQIDSSIEQPAEPVAEGDIPEWLKSMAPQELPDRDKTVDHVTESQETSDQGEVPDWLSGLGTASKATYAEPTQPAAAPQENIFPDWLKEVDHASTSEAGMEEDGSGKALPIEIVPPVPDQPIAEATAEQETTPQGIQETPPEEISTAFPADEGKPLGMQDEAMSWLGNLSAMHGEEEPGSASPNQEEEIPDWLRSISEQPSIENSQVPGSMPVETAPLEQVNLAGEMSADIFPVTSEEDILKETVTGMEPPIDTGERPFGLNEALKSKEPVADDEPPKEYEKLDQEMPDWLHTAEEELPSPLIPETFPPLSETQPLEMITPLEGLAQENATVPADEFSFLKSGDETFPPLDTDKVIVSPMNNVETGMDSQPVESSQKSEELSESLPEWIKNTSQDSMILDETETDGVGKAIQEEDLTITSWLSKKDVEKALGKVRPTSSAPEESATPASEVPSWLKDLDKPPMPEPSAKPVKEVPDWLHQPVEPPEEEVAPVPTPDMSAQTKIPSWMDDTIPVSGPPTPTTPDEWVSVDEKQAPVQDLESIIKQAEPSVETPVQRQILGGTGMLSRVPLADKDAEFLAAAQKSLDARQLQEAMQSYAKLIKKNRLLDEVIHDLREAIYRFPVDISVWQTLGDAYMRANRLQDALDAYTKAEELLR